MLTKNLPKKGEVFSNFIDSYALFHYFLMDHSKYFFYHYLVMIFLQKSIILFNTANHVFYFIFIFTGPGVSDL